MGKLVVGRKPLSGADQGTARDLIVEAAARIFEQHGYADSSLETVGRALGVSKAAIYHHFRRKSEILYEIHIRFICELEERAKDPARSLQPPVEQLRLIVHDILWCMQHRRPYVRVFFEDLRYLDPEQRIAAVTVRDRYHEHVTNLIIQGQASKQVRKFDPEVATRMFFGMSNWTYHWFRPSGRLSADQVAEEMFNMLVSGWSAAPEAVACQGFRPRTATADLWTRDRGAPLWNHAAETLAGEQLETVRWHKLERQLRYCYENSAYYRARFNDVGAELGDITSLERFRQLPALLTKDSQRQTQVESRDAEGHPYGRLVCAPLERLVGVYTTTGTTGDPTFYLFTLRDFQVHAEITARIFWRAGLRPGDCLLWAFGTGAWVAGAIPPGFRFMGVRSINVGTEGGSEALLRFLGLTDARTLVATPSMLDYLIERAPALTRKPVSSLGLERLVVGGEPGAGLPDTRKKFRDAYGADVYDFIGPTSQFGYISCPDGEYRGMHNVAPDMHLWGEDLVDPLTKKPIETRDGAVGEAYMTDLEREAGPVLKFAYGDILQVFTSPCPCGLPGNRIKILGRADDMLVVKGVNIYPAAIKSVVDRYVPRTTGAMRIVLDGPPPLVKPPLQLFVERGEELSDGDASDSLAHELEETLHKELRFRPVVHMVAPASLARGPIKTKLIEVRG